jgi:hypothetical protein
MTGKQRVAVGLGVLTVVAAGVWLSTQGRRDLTPARAQWPPLPHRVEVEVLNGGTVEQAARVATSQLRLGGLDVVLFDNAPAALRDSTRTDPLVLIRRGDTTGVGRVREILGPIEVRDAPDPRPMVDLTVVVGRRDRPAEPAGGSTRSPG